MRFVFCKPIFATILQRYKRIVVSSPAFVFCKPILQIVYKDTNASIPQKKQRIVVSSRAFVFRKPIFATILQRKQRIVVSLRAFVFCKPIFANSLQRYKQSTESPILLRSCPHCGHETPFSDQNDASKIGDSVLWIQAHQSEKKSNASSCHRVRLYFVNPSCK